MITLLFLAGAVSLIDGSAFGWALFATCLILALIFMSVCCLAGYLMTRQR